MVRTAELATCLECCQLPQQILKGHESPNGLENVEKSKFTGTLVSPRLCERAGLDWLWRRVTRRRRRHLRMVGSYVSATRRTHGISASVRTNTAIGQWDHLGAP